jgi:hypothetical protein
MDPIDTFDHVSRPGRRRCPPVLVL